MPPDSYYHPCPVPECERRVGQPYLMCRGDWWRVSRATRDLVYDTFATMQDRARSARQNGKRSARLAYLEARDLAIAEAVASRERATTPPS